MNIRVLCAALLALGMLMGLPWGANAEGVLTVEGTDGRERGIFPLAHTDIVAMVSGDVSEVSVRQTFHNPYTARIDAVYVFPLPDDAAVDELTMRVGLRTIRAEVRPRAEARARYDTARATGHRASLLEQERPNVFTLSVAGIDPGTDIDVSLRYVSLARYDHGVYELAIPMVVGPRYIPGDPLPTPPSGFGTHGDTDRVPDASRVSPPYVLPGTRAGHAVALSVHLDAGAAVTSVTSPSHDVAIQSHGAVVDTSLVDKDQIPNRDFILRWTLDAPALRTVVIATRAEHAPEGYVAVLLQPRRDPPPAERAARELVFLLDTSGSMQGPPMEAARVAVARALESVTPADSFTLIDFADTASTFSSTPVAGTPDNIARALAYLAALTASGGTNQLAGIHAALTLPGDPMRLRYVMFLTDGYIGNEAEIVALAHREIGTTRIFAMGIGTSVNRYLLDEVAAVGRGVAEYLRPGEDSENLIRRFYTRIADPWLTDVSIDWGGLDVHDIDPSPFPDLSSLQPMVLFARYLRPGIAAVTIHGRVAGRPYSQSVPVILPAVEADHHAIGTVWARARIATLVREQSVHGAHPDTTAAITRIALEHHLMSPYTSLVAVDNQVTGQGFSRTVVQPVDGPEGVDLVAAGGGFGSGNGGVSGGAFAAVGTVGHGWGGGGTGGAAIGHITLGCGGGGAGRGLGRSGGNGIGHGALASDPPLVRGAAPAVQGGLDVAVIRRLMLAHLTDLRVCYLRALPSTPGLAGNVTVRFVIDLHGVVHDAVVSSRDAGLSSVASCVAAAVGRLHFPAPVGAPVTVTYPFAFSPPAATSRH